MCYPFVSPLLLFISFIFCMIRTTETFYCILSLIIIMVFYYNVQIIVQYMQRRLLILHCLCYSFYAFMLIWIGPFILIYKQPGLGFMKQLQQKLGRKHKKSSCGYVMWPHYLILVFNLEYIVSWKQKPLQTISILHLTMDWK